MASGQIAILAEELNQASLNRGLSAEKIDRLKVELIPTSNATAILQNCLQIVFFPYGAKAPANSAEFDKVAAQMTATLGDLKHNISVHSPAVKFTGRDVLSQYNANAIFYGLGSIRIRENIALDLRAIRLLISRSATPEAKAGFTRIDEVAKKLAHTVNEACATLENNFATLVTALLKSGE